MIQIMFTYGPETILVKLDGYNVYFNSAEQQKGGATIDNLQLSHQGVVEEFPDLVDDPDWREKAIARFKSHIRSMDSEQERGEYIIAELEKHGYKPTHWQVAGHRMKKFK